MFHWLFVLVTHPVIVLLMNISCLSLHVSALSINIDDNFYLSKMIAQNNPDHEVNKLHCKMMNGEIMFSKNKKNHRCG